MHTPYELFGNETGKGWKDLIEVLEEVRKLYNNAHPEQRIEILQVKEKYGTLRYYINAAPTWFHTLVDTIEHQSGHVCEMCGKAGTRRTDGWVLTLCGVCAKKEGRGLTEIEQAMENKGIPLEKAWLFSSVDRVEQYEQ